MATRSMGHYQAEKRFTIFNSYQKNTPFLKLYP